MASVTNQLNAAFAEIGVIFGGIYVQYRPLTATLPLGTQIATLSAAFDVTALFTFRSPAPYGKPVYYAAVDPSLIQPGDYMVGALGTLFVGGIEPNKPALCVRCNRVVSFTRPTGDSEASNALDIDDYGGRSDATDAVLASGWPASVLIKTRGEASPVELPGDSKQALFETLIPALPGVTLRTSDLMLDDVGQRYAISAVEQTSLGLRLYCPLTVT